MLPQLATSTFPSQIFWVILGFVCIYIFMSVFAAPKLKKILEKRGTHINKTLEAAQTLKAESEKLEKEAAEVLAKVQQEISEFEKKQVAQLDLQNQKEKQKLSDKMAKNVQKEIDSLRDSSRETLEQISSNLDEILDLAMDKIEKGRNVHS